MFKINDYELLYLVLLSIIHDFFIILFNFF